MITNSRTVFSTLFAFGLLATALAQPAPPIPVVWQNLTTDMAVSVTQGWHETLTDLSVSGRPMSIAGKGYEKGLGTHAPGEMVFKLDRQHKQFAAEVGVDDEGGPTGSVVFRVLLDGKMAFDSGLMRFGQAARHIVLDVTGIAELRLVVTDGGDGVQGDHADWANAAVDARPDALLSKLVPRFSTAGFFPVPDSARTVQNFNPGWRFLKADVVGAEKPDFDDSAWEAANLPHGLEILGENASGCRNYQGPAWYRKRFQAAPPPAGGKVYVYFEAVMGKCAVWVNGQKVTEHFGGYLPFVAEISSLLHADGKDNFIAVRADNSNDPTYPPGKPQNDLDFTYMGGIYRDTFLITTPAIHVTLTELSQTVAGGGVFVGVKDVNGNDALLEVRTELANDSAAPRTVTMRTLLETADGRELLRSEQPVTLAAGASQKITQVLEPKNVRLWSPDDPSLHFIRTEIVEDGKVQDTLRTRFGIRLFEMRGQAGFFVNKRFIGVKLNGVNHHQDYAYVGNAMPQSSQWRDIKLLREGGVNAIRAAHYPQAPAFYDACDEFGMLVTTANPGWQFFNSRDPSFEQRIYQDTHNLVRRDRNHPSMLLWETALNETDDQPPRMIREMNRIAHAEYPFPGMFTVTDAPLAKSGGLDFYYGGSYDGTINSFTREYGDGGGVDNFYSQNATTRVNHEWGEGPLLKQAAIRARDLDDCYSAPPIRLGAALWCGIDHQRGYHPDPFLGGILDEFRLPRYTYYLFQSQYDPGYKLPGIKTGPMLYIAHELTQSSDPDVVIYCNCQAVRLTWLGQVVGTQKPDERYRHMPHPPFTFTNVFHFSEINSSWRERTGRIELMAEGLMGTNVAIRVVKKYPERTTGVRVTVDDAGCGLTADGSDFVPVRATIVDNKGVPKVLAEEYVYFEVNGPGEIVSSPLSHTIPVRTELGTATALVRAKTTPGIIRIKARVQGLKSGEAYVASASPALPLDFDEAYAAASKPPATGGQMVMLESGGDQPANVKELKEQVQLLQRELTSKEQDLQDLRGKLKQP
jgi:beta-galactosidase